MTAQPSRIPAAITALLSAVTAAYPATTHIFDGPQHVATELEYSSRVWVGCDPANLDAPAVTGDQQFATLGARSRDERFEVVCAVEYWDGNQDMSAQRTNAFGLLGTFETLLRGTPATGGPGDATLAQALLYAGIGAVEYYPSQDNNGSSCLIVFRVACRARLTTG